MRSTDFKLSRRRFLATAGAALVLPGFLPSRGFGASPSERIVMGIIGCGNRGASNTRDFLREKDCQVVAACDVDAKHLGQVVGIINRHNQNKDCKAYHDYRELLARPDLDGVMIATPDHWHALAAVEAARRKKDIYGEKPLARTIGEQQAIVKAVQENHRIWQTGSWQRSVRNFRKACEIVRNGLIGEVIQVEVGLPDGHHDSGGLAAPLLRKLGVPADNSEYFATVVPGTPAWDAAASEPPPELDFNTWLGPSRLEPYISARVHRNWRWNYNTGGGQLMDWVGHHLDIAHWGLDCDRSGPSEIEAHGEFPPAEAIWNTCTKYRISMKYPRNIKVVVAGGYPEIRSGTKWIGTEGWVWVDRGGFEASNEEWRDYLDLPENLRKVKLYVSNDHFRNFLDCVRSRKPTITPVETAHHSTTPGLLGLISMLVKRKIRWDVASEEILGDPQASVLLNRPYRPPWRLG